MFFKNKKTKNIIYSFDVFDTLITRTFATPDGVFLLMQEKLQQANDFEFIPQSLKHNFYNIRLETQHFCIANQYVLNKKYDCSFDDIYEVIKNNYGLSDDEKESLKQLEIEIELTNILPIEENINKLKKYIQEDKKVILISDMYFSSSIIRKFLVKIDSIFENVDIYTSGDVGKLKFDGTLYKYIKEKYPNTKFVHFGDNKFADFLVPKLYGIKSEKYNPEKLKPYERILLKDEHSLYKNLSVGISRYLRRNNKSKTFQLGCSFAAPLLYGYVDWVLEQSIQRGIKHLYFVARDGYVLKQIADIIIEQKNLDLQTHYFYSSRIANKIPDENNIDKFIKQVCTEYRSESSYEYFAKRLNITIEELNKYISVKNTKQHLSITKTLQFIDKAIKNQELKKLIIDKNKPRKDLFIKYLEQEINLLNNDFAFVELCGSGRTLDNIAQIIIQNSNIKQVSSFFLLLISMTENKEFSKKIFYSYSGDLRLEYLELLCRAEHGQTLGYKEEGNKIIPVLEKINNDFMKKWGYKDYLNSICCYTKLLYKYLKNNNIQSSYMDILKLYFNYYKFNLDKKTKCIINQIPFTDFGSEKNVKKFERCSYIWLLQNYIATNFHQLIRKNLMIILVFANRLNIKVNFLYECYYRIFYK